MYPERRLAPFEPGPEGRAFGRDNTEITGAGGDELEGDDLRCRAASGLREVQGSAGVGVREQTLEHELAERKPCVYMDESGQRQCTSLPCCHGGCGMREWRACAVHACGAERACGNRGERVCTCSSKTCATKTTEIAGAPRARERLNRSSAYGDLLTTGRSREEVGYTSLPKDKNTATESSLRRRGRALNLAGLLSAKQGRKRTTGR